MMIFWIVMIVLFVIIEAATAQLVTIWFAVGSAAALVANILNAPDYVQWIIFIIVSVIVIFCTRPFVKKITKNKSEPTNADRCIGQTAVVTEEIDNIAARGYVKIDGSVWTARSEDGSVIKKDELVTVVKIEGVKLIVKSNN